jgi:uncharacterized membrane protein
MIKCPSCGFSNDDNCTFCAICGSSVTQDDFYVRNTTSTASFSVEDLTKKLISKDKQDNGKTKSFKKLDKATIAREAAKIELEDNVKEYKGSSKKASDKQSKKNADNKNDTSKNDIKTNSNEKNEVKNTESKKEIALDNSKQDTTAVNHNSKNNPVTDKAKDNSSKPNIKKGNKSSDTKSKEINAEPETKAKEIKETANAKENETEKAEAEINSAESKQTASDIKQEESNAKSPEATKVEIPDSAKGSTDGELYRILSRFFFDTKNETALFKQKDIDENCNLVLISYIPFLFFIPMIIKPCSGYLRYHGIQGLTMFLSFVALEFFNIIMGAMFNSIFTEMTGVILTVIITVLINLTVLLLISIGIANAVKGAARELPIIGKYKLLKQYVY